MSRVNTPVADRVLHDVRAVHDAALLPFVLDTKPGAEWGTFRFSPSPVSGAAEQPGTALDIRTKDLVDTTTLEPVESESRPFVITKSGRWDLVATLRPSGLPRNGEYVWTEPMRRIRRLMPEDIYSPFIKGGIALCRFNSGASGSATFDPVYLLPPQWSADVKEAYETIANHPAVFQTELSGESLQNVLQFFRSSQVVLSTMAFRRLLQGRSDDVPLWQTALYDWTGLRRGIAIYSGAVSGKPTEERSLENVITVSVEQASSLDDVKVAAVALLAVNFFQPDIATRRPWLRTLAQSLRKWLSTPEEYLAQVLTFIGTP